MVQYTLAGLALILVLGVGAQFLAWRLRLPDILLLLVVGFVAGPVTGLVEPDRILGPFLFPFVSLAVAVILFEGGLSLDIGELREIGRVVRNLITMQIAVTWILGTALAYLLLDLRLGLAALFAAILTVTGPTVIVPLLRHIRPEGRVGSTVKWEGIVNDPIGALLAVLAFEALVAGGFQRGISVTVAGVLKTVLLGGVLGVAGAALVVIVLRRYWVPDFLQNPIVTTLVIGVFALSNQFQRESGLLAVTVMGVALASQKLVALRHVVEFKEVLRVLLISILFVTLASRLPLTDPDYTSAGSWLFLGSLILLVRPTAVVLATHGSDFTWRERVFLTLMAPRGIVAAAVSSLFAIELARTQPEAARLVPLTFLMIAGTVTIYGLSAPWIARMLGLATPRPQGMLVIGAAPWVRRTAKLLTAENVRVVLADSNWTNVTATRREGLRAHYLNALAERAIDEMDVGGVGRVLALTPNDEVNALAALHFGEVFGRSNVYQLPTGDEHKGGRRQTIPTHLRGRLLFASNASFEYLASRFQSGWIVKKTNLTAEFDYAAFLEYYGGEAIPMFLIRGERDIAIFTVTNPPTPRPGHVLISMVEPRD
jgi:NhaP-type Na+/H+ or K+/H+ antiporter